MESTHSGSTRPLAYTIPDLPNAEFLEYLRNDTAASPRDAGITTSFEPFVGKDKLPARADWITSAALKSTRQRSLATLNPPKSEDCTQEEWKPSQENHHFDEAYSSPCSSSVSSSSYHTAPTSISTGSSISSPRSHTSFLLLASPSPSMQFDPPYLALSTSDNSLFASSSSPLLPATIFPSTFPSFSSSSASSSTSTSSAVSEGDYYTRFDDTDESREDTPNDSSSDDASHGYDLFTLSWKTLVTAFSQSPDRSSPGLSYSHRLSPTHLPTSVDHQLKLRTLNDYGNSLWGGLLGANDAVLSFVQRTLKEGFSRTNGGETEAERVAWMHEKGRTWVRGDKVPIAQHPAQATWQFSKENIWALVRTGCNSLIRRGIIDAAATAASATGVKLVGGHGATDPVYAGSIGVRNSGYTGLGIDGHEEDEEDDDDGDDYGTDFILESWRERGLQREELDMTREEDSEWEMVGFQARRPPGG